MSDLLIIDETGNDGGSPWGTSQFYIHGAVAFRSLSRKHYRQIMDDVRRRSKLPSIHMTELHREQRLNVAWHAVERLCDVEHCFIYGCIEKIFYPGEALSDICTDTIVRNDSGREIKANKFYKAVIDLLANVLMSPGLKKRIWGAIGSSEGSKIELALTAAYDSFANSQSEFLRFLAERIEAISREYDIYNLMANGLRYHRVRYKIANRAYRDMFDHIENYYRGRSKPMIIHEENVGLLNDLSKKEMSKLPRRNRRAIKTPLMDTVEFVKDKSMCEIADIFLWHRKTFEEEMLASFRASNRTGLPSYFSELSLKFEAKSIGMARTRITALNNLVITPESVQTEEAFKALYDELMLYWKEFNTACDMRPS
jgi:hypothetical protein